MSRGNQSMNYSNKTPLTPTNATSISNHRQTTITQLFTPNSKRKATSPNSSPTAKKVTQDKMAQFTLEDIEKLMEKQSASIKDNIKNEVKSMGDDLKENFRGEIKKLYERVNAIETNVSKQISELKADFDSCVNRLNNTEDDLIRISKLNELKINGIAYTANENLVEIFNSIAKLIGYDTSNGINMPEIFRMQKINK